MTPVFLEVKNLTKHFPVSNGMFAKKGYVHAVNDVSFDVFSSETLGIVGESGSGKSTLGRVILKLIEPTAGEVIYQGKNIFKGNEEQIRRDMQMVFQDPYASLNPRLKIGDAIAEPLHAHKIVSNSKEAHERVIELLRLVGLQPEMYENYPHEFSGGQRQRISIARALGLEPKLLICDEAVSALDVSVQAQVLNLFNQLKQKLNLTYLFISHDLAVIKFISTRILIMYLGEMMELASTEDLFNRPLHPYTEALISAIPEPSTHKKKGRILLEGDIPSSIQLPQGCKFQTRCFKAMPECKTVHPPLVEAEPNHFVRCLLYSKKQEG
jgi:oligopeptide/dipeptide ABC transporter ATP-binding protein